MKSLTKDARLFVDGIVGQLKKGKGKDQRLPKIQSLLRKVSDQAWQKNTAKVISTIPLTVSEKEEITTSLSKKMGIDIVIVSEVDPALIGGIRIEVADYVLDMSYKEQLQRIQSVLLKGSHI